MTSSPWSGLPVNRDRLKASLVLQHGFREKEAEDLVMDRADLLEAMLIEQSERLVTTREAVERVLKGSDHECSEIRCAVRVAS